MNEDYIQEPVTEVTENTEAQPVEENEEGIELTDTASNDEEKESVKTYTEEDLEKIVNQRINDILPNKIEKEKRKLERKYKDRLSNLDETESILKQGFGAKDLADANQKMREFYKEQGIDIPDYQRPKYSDEDEKDLGELDAKKVIKLGFEEMQDEANRLADIGTDNMTLREKAMFTALAKELTIQKNRNELIKLGVKEDLLNDDEFKKFSNKFNKDVPIKDIYEMYSQVNNKQKKYEQIGSLKNPSPKVEKDYYTDEEIDKLSYDDLDKPGVWDIVRKSMTSKR